MDGAPVTGGGPAPFLLKTYEMVDDSSTDDIVSWSSTKNSFIVWNPPEFARLLLPTYFKHNNFSSFIRQLNTYGFRKIDPERWEFANEDFVKDQKHLLKNIHRRKPIHSHSQPQGDPERAAFDEEIDKLIREKAAIEATLLRSKQEQSAAKLQFEELTQRVGGLEQRQEKLITSLEKAVQDHNFVEHLARKLESMDVSAYNKKKRRLPEVDKSILPVCEISYVDNNHCSSGPEPEPRSSSIFHQDFSNKLRLELSPAVSDVNLVSRSSTLSSNEEGGSSLVRLSAEGYTQTRSGGGFMFSPEPLELSDTGTSFTFKMNSSSSLASKAAAVAGSSERLTYNEEGGDGGISSCQLNLTLASSSSSIQGDRSRYSSRTLPQYGPGIGEFLEPMFNANDIRVASPKNRSVSDDDDETSLSSKKKVPMTNNQGGGPPMPSNAPTVRVNDLFWEQFLTEKPGSSETEEANNYDEDDDDDNDNEEARRSGAPGVSRYTNSSVDHLTL